MPAKKSLQIAGKEALNFKPLHDRILVERDAPRTTHGRLYLAETAREEPLTGTVIKTGAGAPFLNRDGVHKPCVEPGDHVLFERFAGIEYKWPEDAPDDKQTKYVILADSDILGVFL